MIAPNDPKDVEPAPETPAAATPAAAQQAATPLAPPELRVLLDDVFAGPLDLLLHLVKEQEVEITEVSLARVCDEFLRYVRALAALDLGRAGDYLVVAATLVAIKSRALVPSGEAVEFDDEVDPGDDLLKRLLQYRRVRDVSRELGSRAALREMLYSRGEHDVPPLAPGEFDLSDVGAWDLLSAFAKILREVGAPTASHTIRRPDRSVAEFVRDVSETLAAKPKVRFEELFEGARSVDGSIHRDWLIGTFLAILELAKQGAIDVRQGDLFGSIDLARRVDDVAEFRRLVAGISSVEASTEMATGAIVPPPSTAP